MPSNSRGKARGSGKRGTVLRVHAKFRKGEIVYHADVPLTVIRIDAGEPGYWCDDGRFFSEDELSKKPQRLPSNGGQP